MQDQETQTTGELEMRLKGLEEMNRVLKEQNDAFRKAIAESSLAPPSMGSDGLPEDPYVINVDLWPQMTQFMTVPVSKSLIAGPGEQSSWVDPSLSRASGVIDVGWANLADSDCNIIVHGCNCVGVMNSGVARAIRDRWPEVASADQLTPMNDPRKLGHFSSCLTRGGVTVVNLYTQVDYGGRDKRRACYRAIRLGLVRFVSVLKRHPLAWPRVKIGTCYIGCGNGGALRSVVRGIIDSVFREAGLPIHVYDGDSTPTPPSSSSTPAKLQLLQQSPAPAQRIPDAVVSPAVVSQAQARIVQQQVPLPTGRSKKYVVFHVPNDYDDTKLVTSLPGAVEAHVITKQDKTFAMVFFRSDDDAKRLQSADVWLPGSTRPIDIEVSKDQTVRPNWRTSAGSFLFAAPGPVPVTPLVAHTTSSWPRSPPIQQGNGPTVTRQVIETPLQPPQAKRRNTGETYSPDDGTFTD